MRIFSVREAGHRRPLEAIQALFRLRCGPSDRLPRQQTVGYLWRKFKPAAYHVDLEARMPADHLLRPIRAIVDDALSALSGESAALYSHLGRPSIPPERLLRAHAAAGVLLGALGAAADRI